MKDLRPPALSIEAFETGCIDADAFDHEAHVRVAWLYLREYPATEATRRFCAALRRLTVALGAPGKYHETITRFYLRVIAQRHQDEPARDWEAFRAANRDLFGGSDNVLNRYYSPELLATPRAREIYLPPDREPLPA